MPMTMYEIAFPVTINIGAWAVVYVRQIGQIATADLVRLEKTFPGRFRRRYFPYPLKGRTLLESLSFCIQR